MRLAMNEADKATLEGNSPFGAVISDNEGNLIDSAHNTTNTESDPTAHAEINLIRKVSKNLGNKDLSRYYLISNAQSCSMCMSAAIKAKITNFVFGADSESHMNPNLNVLEVAKYSKSHLHIESGILKEECENQIKKARKTN